MAIDRKKALQELVDWCWDQRQKALDGIAFFTETRKHIARIGTQKPNHLLRDDTRDHIAGLRQTVTDMDDLLADIEKDNV